MNANARPIEDAYATFSDTDTVRLQRPVARSMQHRLTPNHLLGRVNVTTRIFTRGIIVFGALAAGALLACAACGSLPPTEAEPVHEERAVEAPAPRRIASEDARKRRSA